MQMKHKDSQCFEADFSESETIAKPDTLHKTTSETSMSNNQLTFVMTGNRFDTHVPKTVSTCWNVVLKTNLMYHTGSDIGTLKVKHWTQKK